MMETISALTIRAPWAHAILHLGKDVENRSYPIKHRGPLLIHTSARLARADREAASRLGIEVGQLITGAIIGVVDVVDCVRGARSRWADADCWHWLLANPRAFRRPIPYRGQLRVFQVPRDVLAARRRTGRLAAARRMKRASPATPPSSSRRIGALII
jgi:hypothetical protein